MYSSLRSFKHDYSNIMLSMSEYFEANDMEGLRSYFNKEILPLSRKITKNTAHINQLMNIKITELKSILSSKLLYAIELNIDVSIEVTDEVISLPMNTLDLCRIAGIFLDNAIEATLETAYPSIRFALINLDAEYIFIISNTFLDKGIPRLCPFVDTFGFANVAYGIPLSKKVLEIIKMYSASRFINAKEEEITFQILRQ